jgi:hypothetical protein
MNNAFNTPKSGLVKEMCEEQGISFVELPLVKPTTELSLEQALNKYLEAIKADYRSWGKIDKMDDQEKMESVAGKMATEFDAGLHIEEGSKYLKVITKSGSSRSVHSFIVKEDGPKFKCGDILKAAGWNAPAKNKARGNIFGTYRVLWTGAEYLR